MRKSEVMNRSGDDRRVDPPKDDFGSSEDGLHAASEGHSDFLL
jgi:hypothetical protein